MNTIKKFIKINQKEKGEYSLEEILIKFSNLTSKIARQYCSYAQKYSNHTSYLDYDDLKQIADIGLMDAYNKYNYQYSKNNNESNVMGFIPYARKTIEGYILKHFYDVLKLRRKDYNLHQVFVSSIHAPILNDKGDSLYLEDIIENDNYNDLLISEIKIDIDNSMQNLTDSQRNMIYDFFYLNKTQKQLSNKYNISQSHVSRIIRKSLAIMKKDFQKSNKDKNINKGNIIKPKSTKGDKQMKKSTSSINTAHALKFLKQHIKDNRPIDSVIDMYCAKYDISKSELNYMLHTTCSDEFNSIVDKYIEKEESKNNNINPFDGLDVLDISIKLQLFNAIISPSHIALMDLPEGTPLSIDDLINLKNDIDKIIELKSYFEGTKVG